MVAGGFVRCGLRCFCRAYLSVCYFAIENPDCGLFAQYGGVTGYGGCDYDRIGDLLCVLRGGAAGLVRAAGEVVGEAFEVVSQPADFSGAVLFADGVDFHVFGGVVHGVVLWLCRGGGGFAPVAVCFFQVFAARKGFAAGGAFSGEPFCVRDRFAYDGERECDIPGGERADKLEGFGGGVRVVRDSFPGGYGME